MGADGGGVDTPAPQTVTLTDMPVVLGVVGTADVVANSLSPLMFAAAFEATGMRGFYVPLAVRASSARKALRSLPRLGFRGVNVTMPFKRLAAEIAHERSELVAVTGVANTLVIADNGIITAEATDGYAVEAAIVNAGTDLAGATVTVLGAGGAAMEAAWACCRAGASTVRVWNRTPDAAQALVDRLFLAFPKTTLEISGSVPIGDAADVLVSCVPTQAFENIDLTDIEAHTLVVDLAYRRDGLPTPVIRAAQTRGVAHVDGRELLFRQGAASFTAWFDAEPPTGAMLRAIS